MNNRSVTLRKPLALLCVGLSLIAAQAAFGQAPAAIDKKEDTLSLDKFVVTGSNIPTAKNEPSVPIDVYSRNQIESLGVQTTADLLQMIPQVVGSGNYRGEQTSNPGGGEATVALRGLPASATLVLVNGRRVALTSAISLDNSAVNINTIPLAAVDHVEILREGAGPVYGSDAIAGVVNIILRDKYRGAEITTEYGNTTKKDAGQLITSLIVGTGNDTTDIMISGSFFESNAVYSRDRDIVKTADYRYQGAANGGRDRRSSAAPRGRIFVSETKDPVGLGLQYNGAAGGTGTALANYSPWTTNSPYDFRAITAEVLPQTRYGFTMTAKHKISDTLKLFAEAGYTHIKSFTESAPTPFFSDQEPFQNLAGNIVQMTIPINNRYNPFGAGSSDGLYAVDAVYKRFLELGPRSTTTNVNNVRLLTGLQGTVGGWAWEVGALFSRDGTVNVNDNLINKKELYDQLQNSNPAVASVNVFGDYTYNLKDAAQRAALERIRLKAINESSYQITQLDAKAHGTLVDLPAGPLQMAGGIERRRERLDFNPDSAITSFNTIGSTNQIATHGSRDVTSVYTEFSVPLLKDLPAVHSLDAQAAVRYEDYSDFGTTTKPGMSLRWKPVDDSFALRVSYSEGFRAATLQELYLGGQESFEDLINPNAPTQIQVRNLQSGNPNLDPETSKSWNFGLVYSPKPIKGLTVRLDYYSVFKKDNIGALEAQFVFDEFLAGNPAFAKAVDINAATKYATAIRTPNSNLGKEVSRGFDYGVTYEMPTDNLGKFTFAVDGAYLSTYLYTPDKTSPYIESAGDWNDGAGNSLPRNRGRFSTLWNYQNYEVTLDWNYIWGLREEIAATKSTHRIPKYNTIDLQVGYPLIGGIKLTVGVNNVLDEKVPFIGGAASDGYDNSSYDILGRQYYVRLNKKF